MIAGQARRASGGRALRLLLRPRRLRVNGMGNDITQGQVLPRLVSRLL